VAALTGATLALSLLLLTSSAAAGGWLLPILGALALTIAIAMMLGLRSLPVQGRSPE